MAGSNAQATRVSLYLSSKSLPPASGWLGEFLQTQKPNLPMTALERTAHFRLLASDITTSLESSTTSIFPEDALNAEIKERRLTGPIPVQVLDVEDVSRSRWSQIEAIEAIERGEMTKGREVIRMVPGEEGLSTPESASGGVHKLLIQDGKGTRIYGFELAKVDGIGMNMNIGSKVLLKNAVMARGVVLLEPATTTVLGGKIEGLHKAWVEGRKARLKAAIDASEAP